ncbi:MAG: addiction module toxin, Txe/YoeB family [Flavipsychrobacter sp.]|jgi:toxin YoeB|nr:addiction module toxin, Txe/YoeB family [Flavipsychrobacter sp.]
MKPIQFESSAYQDYIDWAKANVDIFEKINRLIIDIDRNLFKGLGKPEPLKGNLKGYWSRRITEEHRLVYKIEKGIIYVYSCHGHYE